jgi:GT2 family glycosyltransferase
MRGTGHEAACPTFYGVFPYAHGNNFGVTRALLEQLGGFDPRFIGGEDIEFSMRAWLRGVPVAYTDRAMVHYRFRTTPGALWRQGFGYGLVRPAIKASLRRNDRPTPPALAGWKSWLWLISRLPTALTPHGRCNVAWAAGNRLGQVVGSIRARSVLV